MTRYIRRTLVVLTAVLATLAPSAVAHAAASKAEVLSSWTQTSVSSYNAWNAARQNQGAWATYNFDWSTDYCSSSPDNPLGFNFELSCWHHDFGYRNYKAIGAFPANKARVDSMFYADLQRRCDTYSRLLQPPCNALAWVYYQAVKNFGSLAAVQPADIDRARKLMPAESSR
ncbi:phospholipase [Actinoplanes sp. NPDC049265]|uniref:phospholipase n=1 Tax=Actinoplanes sp. NPDC049265 TaxID=3363902 RepID=UPI003718FBA5